MVPLIVTILNRVYILIQSIRAFFVNVSFCLVYDIGDILFSYNDTSLINVLNTSQNVTPTQNSINDLQQHLTTIFETIDFEFIVTDEIIFELENVTTLFTGRKKRAAAYILKIINIFFKKF